MNLNKKAGDRILNTKYGNIKQVDNLKNLEKINTLNDHEKLTIEIIH